MANRALTVAIATATGRVESVRSFTYSTSTPTCSITWKGAAQDNEWFDPNNWAPQRLPAAGDWVCIPATTGNRIKFDTGASSSIAGLNSSLSVNIAAGTLTLSDGVDGSTIPALALTGGTISGAGNLTLPGSSVWTGGQMVGTGTTTVPAGARLDVGIPNCCTVSTDGSRTLAIAGTMTVAGSSSLQLNGASSIVNTGLVNILGDNASISGGSGTVFTNTSSGTLEKSAGTGESEISLPFDNAGLVDAAAGSFIFEFGIQQVDGLSGSYNISTGSTLVLGSPPVSIPSGATISGGGTLEVNGQVTLAPGASVHTGGLIIDSGATLQVNLAGHTAGSSYPQLVVNGTAQLSGNLVAATVSVTVLRLPGNNLRRSPLPEALGNVHVGSRCSR